jgi:hypothetical protein
MHGTKPHVTKHARNQVRNDALTNGTDSGLSPNPPGRRLGPAIGEAPMSTDPGIWGWTSDIGRLGFTVTFSLGLSPEDVLAHYGVSASGAEHFTREEAWTRYPASYGGTRLRAGTLGRWGFCFEEAGVEGIKARTLSALSADTETISFFSAPTTHSFLYLKDGQGIEAFEPGLPSTLRGDEPYRFWSNTQRILERANPGSPVDPAHAVLQTIAKHIRGLLDRSVLEGPLLTAFTSAADGEPAETGFEERPEPQELAAGPVAAFAAPLTTSGLTTSGLWNSDPLPVDEFPVAPLSGYGRFRGGEARAS